MFDINFKTILISVFLLISLVPEIASRGTRTRNQWYWPTQEESTLPVPLGFYSKPPSNPKCVGKYEIVEPDFAEEHNKQQQRRTHRILSPTKEEAIFPTNITFVLSEETKKCFRVYETYACKPTGASLQFFNLTGNKQIFGLNVGGKEEEKERLLNFNLDPISFEPCLQEDEETLKKNQCQSQFHLKIKYQVTKTHPIINDNCVNLQKPRKTSPLTRTQAEVFIVRDNPHNLGTICLEFFSEQNCQGKTVRLVLPHTSFLWTKPHGSNIVKIWEFYSDKNAIPIVDTDINSVRKCSYCRNDEKNIKDENLLIPYTSPVKATPFPPPTEVMTLKPSTGSITTLIPISAASKADGNLNKDSCNFYECFSIPRIVKGDLQNWIEEMSRKGHDLDILPDTVCYFYFQDPNCTTQPVIKEDRMINETLVEALAKKHPKFGNWSVAHCEDLQKSQNPECEIPIFDDKSIEDVFSTEEIKVAESQQFSRAEKIVLCVAGAVAFIMFVCVVIMAILLCRKKRRIRELRKRCIPKRQDEQQQQLTQRHLNFHQTDPIDENDYVNDITGLSAMCKSFRGEEADGNSYEIPRDHINIGNIRDSTAPIIGTGEFSIAFKGTLEPSGKIVAVKTMKTGQVTTKTLKSALRECQVFMEVGKHPRIAEFLGVCTENVRKGELFIVMEWCEKGSLKAFLGQHKNNFDNLVEDGEWLGDDKMAIAINSKYTIREGPPVVFNTLQLFKWCLEVADAMEFLSVRKIVHVSLSARNILLDGKFSCKISDFHFAKLPGDFTRNRAFSNANRTNKERVIPWRWFAVESLLDDLFSSQSDVWTFGVFMWEVFSLGATPFPEYTFGSEFTLIIKHGYRLQIPNYATVESYQLMLMCWYDAPEKRPTFTKLKIRLENLIPKKIPINRGPVRIIRSLSKNNSIDSTIESKTSR